MEFTMQVKESNGYRFITKCNGTEDRLMYCVLGDSPDETSGSGSENSSLVYVYAGVRCGGRYISYST